MTIGRREACRRVGAIASAALWPVWSAAAQQPPPDIAPVPFRSGVDLVRLPVTARDAAGRIVHDLEAKDFDIFEDGVRQQMGLFGHHATPISVVLLLDKSASMMGDKMMHAKDGVINFVNALRREDEVLVIAFSDSVDALGTFGLTARAIEAAVKQVETERGTRLYDAIEKAAREIASPGRKDKRAMVILSDGADTSSRSRLDDAVNAVRHAEVPVYAIAIEYADQAWWAPPPSSQWRSLLSGSELDPLHRITDGTGGWTYPIEAAGRCKEVCLRIADELRNQYLLAYYSTNEVRDGQWRTIAVQTNRPGVTLATRSGYYAAGS